MIIIATQPGVRQCSHALREAVQAVATPGVLARRCAALLARLAPFGLLRRRDAPPAAPLATRPLPAAGGTLEQLALCETLGRWGGHQLTLYERSAGLRGRHLFGRLDSG